MQFTSVAFLLFVLATASLTALARGAARLWLIIGFSLIFAATYVPSWLAAVPLALFILAGYGALIMAESGRMRHAVGVWLAVLVGVFIWLKHYPFVAALPQLPFAYVTVGLSYILFRLLHLLLEIGGGMMKRPPFPLYFAYLIFFPSFLSGPINRYDPFAQDMASPTPFNDDTAFGVLARLLLGLAKVAVIGECILMVHGMVAPRLDGAVEAGESSLRIGLVYALAAPLYLLFLYANFSGYTDMAIAIARLFGIRLPENFDRPFLAINFQDFWSRWHISLSEWFKVYFFNPLLKVMMSVWPSAKAAPYLGVVALFVVFLVLGAWHGASWEYMLCGALLATGVAVNKLWQVELTKRMGKKPYQAFTKRPVYHWASRGLTLAWVSLALTPFWISVTGIATLTRSAGLIGFVTALVLMSALFALSVLAVMTILARFVRPAERPAPRRSYRLTLLAMAMLTLAFAMPLVNSSTDFVYKAF